MSDALRLIKKYPNRRLYDTANSGYITLADVKQMVLENIDFQVIDAKSGDDLTRAILLQIILEEESGGLPMFSSEMLAQMIRFYGTAQQTMMGTYMEQNVKAFLGIQKKLQEQMKQIYGDKLLLTPDLWKQFMQMQAPAMQGMLAQLPRTEREALHGHAAADAGADARDVRGISVSQLRCCAANGGRGAEVARVAQRATTSRAPRPAFLQRSIHLGAFPRRPFCCSALAPLAGSRTPGRAGRRRPTALRG